MYTIYMIIDVCFEAAVSMEKDAAATLAWHGMGMQDIPNTNSAQDLKIQVETLAFKPLGSLDDMDGSGGPCEVWVEAFSSKRRFFHVMNAESLAVYKVRQNERKGKEHIAFKVCRCVQDIYDIYIYIY